MDNSSLAEKHRHIFFCLLFIVSILSCSQHNENKDKAIDTKIGFSTGPNIGEKVPAFNLPDQDGNIKSLDELVGKMRHLFSKIKNKFSGL